MLSFEECWDLFKTEQEFELNYHYKEAGYTREEYWAVINPKAAFDLYESTLPEDCKEYGYQMMEEYVSPEEREYRDYLELDTKITEEVLEFHHIEPEPILDWKV